MRTFLPGEPASTTFELIPCNWTYASPSIDDQFDYEIKQQNYRETAKYTLWYRYWVCYWSLKNLSNRIPEIHLRSIPRSVFLLEPEIPIIAQNKIEIALFILFYEYRHSFQRMDADVTAEDAPDSMPHQNSLRDLATKLSSSMGLSFRGSAVTVTVSRRAPFDFPQHNIFNMPGWTSLCR